MDTGQERTLLTPEGSFITCKEALMEFIYAIGGIIGLGIFAAIFGVDIRDLRQSSHGSLNDANTTLGVTEQVVSELLDSSRD